LKALKENGNTLILSNFIKNRNLYQEIYVIDLKVISYEISVTKEKLQRA
jgi:hypothetical protein